MLRRLSFFLWAASIGLFGPLKVATGLNNVLFHRITGRYLGDHIIETLKTKCEIECGANCLNEAECVSVNFKVTGNDKGLCELNSKTLDEIEDGGQNAPEYIYLGIIQRVTIIILIDVFIF